MIIKIKNTKQYLTNFNDWIVSVTKYENYSTLLNNYCQRIIYLKRNVFFLHRLYTMYCVLDFQQIWYHIIHANNLAMGFHSHLLRLDSMKWRTSKKKNNIIE